MPVSRAFLRFSGRMHFSTRLANAEQVKAKVVKIKNLNQDQEPVEDQKTNFRRINHENKLLFGALLETKKERDKRISNKSCDISASLDTIATAKVKKASRKKSEVESESKSPAAPSSKKSSVKASKEKSPAPEKKGRKKKNEVKENSTLSSKETNSEKVESSAKAHTDLSSPQMSDKLQNGSECAEEREADTEAAPFPLGNESKLELVIKPGSEIIVGRTITKSDGFYKYPSVTRILNLTMSEASKSALLRWRSGLIAEMGEEKFQEFHANQLHAGSLFHSSLQEYLQQVPKNKSVLDPELEGCWKSLDSVFKRISEVKLLESHVVHEELRYRGVIDCIAMYRDTPLIIEWKKSGKPKYTLEMTYDAPVQLCAYIGALNYDSSYPFKVSKGVVVVAYHDGTPANVFPLTMSQLQSHWKAWMVRYKKFTDMVHIDSAEKDTTKTVKKEAI